MRKIFAFFVIFLCSTNINSAFCAQNFDWVWNVLVIPPSSGWDTEPGKSVKTALSWCEKEISESSSGIGGHDIKFITVQRPSSPDISIQDINLSIDPQTIAVMSFTFSPEDDRILTAKMAGSNIPLMLSGGENVLIDRGGRPLRNVFALDLYRDYRCDAFTQYAKKLYVRDTRIALVASRFTVNQEREAKICYSMLDDAGFMPMPYWTDSSVRDSYAMMSEEIESFEGEKSGVVISFMGGMGSREIWRNFMRLRTSWRLWNCAEPEGIYLSCRGMIFADQNIKLSKLGGFIETKRLLWRTRAMQVDDSVAAGRVLALYEWLKRAVDIMPQPIDDMPRDEFLRNLSRVKNIPFGNQILNITPELHRPSNRDVYIVEIRNREFEDIDIVKTRGLAYRPNY